MDARGRRGLDVTFVHAGLIEGHVLRNAEVLLNFLLGVAEVITALDQLYIDGKIVGGHLLSEVRTDRGKKCARWSLESRVDIDRQ
jgi:hypothetical protein